MNYFGNRLQSLQKSTDGEQEDGILKNSMNNSTDSITSENSNLLPPKGFLKEEIFSRDLIDVSNQYMFRNPGTTSLESMRVICDEYTRSYVGVTVGSNEPDIINSVYDIGLEDNSLNIIRNYHPCHCSWPSNGKKNIPLDLKKYLVGKNTDDKCILVKFFYCNLRRSPFEPIFMSLILFCFQDGNFVRISESHHWDITPKQVKPRYPFIYPNISQSEYMSNYQLYENSPCIFSIPSDLANENVFIVVQLSKVLSGNTESALAPYQKTSNNLKLDETKHIESCERLQDYRQTLGFGVIRVFDENGVCGQHGGPNVSFPIYALKQATTDSELGQFIQELFPIGQSATNTAATAVKVKLETLEFEPIITIHSIGPDKVIIVLFLILFH